MVTKTNALALLTNLVSAVGKKNNGQTNGLSLIKENQIYRAFLHANSTRHSHSILMMASYFELCIMYFIKIIICHVFHGLVMSLFV